MTESVVDVPLDWYHATVVYSQTLPPMSFLDIAGLDPSDGPLCVMLEHGQFDDLIEVRDWLQERECGFRLFGRYGITRCDYQITSRFLGFNFSFDRMEESCLFKLFWGGAMLGQVAQAVM